jgi:hypothetical protein
MNISDLVYNYVPPRVKRSLSIAKILQVVRNNQIEQSYL